MLLISGPPHNQGPARGRISAETLNPSAGAFVRNASEECLSEQYFPNLACTKEIAFWREDYNKSRPHTSLGFLSPNRRAA